MLSDDGADLVAIDIDITDTSIVHDALRTAANATVNAECEPVTHLIDAVDERQQILGFVADDVKHWAEYFPLHIVDVIDFDKRRRDESAASGLIRIGSNGRYDLRIRCEIIQNSTLCFFIDHGTDVRIEFARIADAKFFQRSLEKCKRRIRNLFLQAKYA